MREDWTFWIILWIILPLFQFLMLWAQFNWLLGKLERITFKVRGMSLEAKRILLKKLKKKSKANGKKLRENIDNFLEFFAVQPVSLDPFGIIRKLEHLARLAKKKWEYFVERIGKGFEKEDKANLLMTLLTTYSLHSLYKLMRHYVEYLRKHRSLQLAYMFQLLTQDVEKISKSLLFATEAFSNGWPIGDSIGALVAASFIGKRDKIREMKKYETIWVRKKIKGKEVIILKAKGPGGRLGELGRSVEKLAKKFKIAKIITVDAALKLEGEKTGKVAEGVGVAIGGLGVDRAFIEELATKKKIPLDSFIIKMSQYEAILPMKKSIFSSLEKVKQLIEKNIEETKGKGIVVIVGVGNSCGVGNDSSYVVQIQQLVKKFERMKKFEVEEKKPEFLGFPV